MTDKKLDAIFINAMRAVAYLVFVLAIVGLIDVINLIGGWIW